VPKLELLSQVRAASAFYKTAALASPSARKTRWFFTRSPAGPIFQSFAFPVYLARL